MQTGSPLHDPCIHHLLHRAGGFVKIEPAARPLSPPMRITVTGVGFQYASISHYALQPHVAGLADEVTLGFTTLHLSR